MLHLDKFFSAVFRKNVWKVKDANKIIASDLEKDAFAYAKIECGRIDEIKALENADFNLIDTCTLYERELREEFPTLFIPSKYEIRFANQADKESILNIAYTNFSFSRFHLDPLIDNSLANAIKREWAGNYFTGERGDWMVVLVFDNNVVGFLQLISAEHKLIVDLIAIDQRHQRKGLAGAMINFAAKHCDSHACISVSTQIHNIPSTRAYEKNGFRLSNAHYIFHYHG